MLFSRTVHQVAVLPYRQDENGAVEILLITSRGRGRWILPKGWPERHQTLAETAQTEGHEEAGIEGEITKTPIGSYHYIKRVKQGYRVPCHVTIFPMLVTNQLEQWDEKGQREQEWFSFDEAVQTANDPDLQRLLNRLASLPSSQLIEVLKTPSKLPTLPLHQRLLDSLKVIGARLVAPFYRSLAREE